MNAENTTLTKHDRTQTVSADRVYTPRADLYAGQESLLLQVDLPGVSADGLTVEVHRGQLHLEGRRSDTLRYRRVLKLPEGIDTEGIVADLEHGVLTVTLPKAESHKPRRIRVRTG